jgi:hypothetical protein
MPGNLVAVGRASVENTVRHPLTSLTPGPATPASVGLEAVADGVPTAPNVIIESSAGKSSQLHFPIKLLSERHLR